MVCLVSLFLLVSGYTLVFETEFKEFTMLMTGIGFLIIGAFAPITTFTSFADYGIMKEEIQKLEAKKH
jgi:polyferredoxin